MTVFVTGGAGFIGFYLIKSLLNNGHKVIGLDNINNYYSTKLKFARLKELGIDQSNAQINEVPCFSDIYPNFTFYKSDLSDSKTLNAIFKKYTFDSVCHLAAQAGVRYSITNPSVYVQSNLVGFANILEEVRQAGINHFIYASSSSVYGESKNIPFRTDDNVDRPVSFYAATKKSNELMAHTYSQLFGFATTGLRFFTVYGPYGRPDMAYYLFTKAIYNDLPIKVFNNGAMYRDFTYIDDIVEGVVKIIETPLGKREKYKIYNLGNNKSEKLGDFITTIERHLGKISKKEMHPMQPGDVIQTYADSSELIKDYDYTPNTSIYEGLKQFVEWFKNCEIAKKV